MADSIAALITVFEDVLTAVLTGLGQVAGFVMTQPLLILAFAFTIAGFIFNRARSFIRQ